MAQPRGVGERGNQRLKAEKLDCKRVLCWVLALSISQSDIYIYFFSPRICIESYLDNRRREGRGAYGEYSAALAGWLAGCLALPAGHL